MSSAILQDSPRLVFVLGMHRSGTSAVTRALPVVGVDIGSHHLARFDNPRGFFENPDFVHLNEALLDSCGLDWESVQRPTKADVSRLLTSNFVSAGRAFLASFTGRARVVGLKDPRLCRLLPFWLPLCAADGIDVTCLIVLRAPHLVAASLQKRDHMPLSKAHALWTAYTTDALLCTRTVPRLLLSYDRLLDQTHRELVRLAHFLSLPLSSEEEVRFSREFLQKNLRHHTKNDRTACTEQVSSSLYMRLEPCTECLTSDLLDSARMTHALLKASSSVYDSLSNG